MKLTPAAFGKAYLRSLEQEALEADSQYKDAKSLKNQVLHKRNHNKNGVDSILYTQACILEQNAQAHRHLVLTAYRQERELVSH